MPTGSIVGHLVGDFLLQNDWMAQNKKKHSLPCVVHVTLYTLAVMLLSGWAWHPAWPWLALSVWIPHFAIDRSQFVTWYMRTIGQAAFMTAPMSPWSIIAVDNSMHLLCLLGTGQLALLLLP